MRRACRIARSLDAVGRQNGRRAHVARFIAWFCAAIKLLIRGRDKVLRPAAPQHVGVCASVVERSSGGLVLLLSRRQSATPPENLLKLKVWQCQVPCSRPCSPQPHVLAGRHLRAGRSVQRALRHHHVGLLQRLRGAEPACAQRCAERVAGRRPLRRLRRLREVQTRAHAQRVGCHRRSAKCALPNTGRRTAAPLCCIHSPSSAVLLSIRLALRGWQCRQRTLCKA